MYVSCFSLFFLPGNPCKNLLRKVGISLTMQSSQSGDGSLIDYSFGSSIILIISIRERSAFIVYFYRLNSGSSNQCNRLDMLRMREHIHRLNFLYLIAVFDQIQQIPLLCFGVAGNIDYFFRCRLHKAV